MPGIRRGVANGPAVVAATGVARAMAAAMVVDGLSTATVRVVPAPLATAATTMPAALAPSVASMATGRSVASGTLTGPANLAGGPGVLAGRVPSGRTALDSVRARRVRRMSA